VGFGSLCGGGVVRWALSEENHGNMIKEEEGSRKMDTEAQREAGRDRHAQTARLSFS